MSAGKPSSSLWDRAFELLDPGTQKGLDPSKTNRRDVLSAVLKDVESARDLALRKRWKFTKSNGDVVIVRDVMEKIVGWIQRFKETGDAAVQYDPGHAALPWAAFRFLLQTTVSEVQVFSAVVGDLEEVARNLARYRIFERLHLRGTQTQSEIQVEIEHALIRLYAEVLAQLSYAVKFFNERAITRVLKSPFRTVKEDRKKELQARENDVNQLATLADTEILRSLDATFERISIQSTKVLSEDNFNEIVTWLSVAPYYSHHQFVTESRLAGVGQWLLNHQEYLQWLTSSSPSLCYLHGIPGSGKSTLCSVVVDSMLSLAGSSPSATPLGYFYCANPEFEKARRSCDDVLRTILFQLSIDSSSRLTVKQFLCSEYERQVARSPAGRRDVMKLRTKDCVRLILELAEQDPITIIIDGMDSVEDEDRHTLIKALEDIISQADNVAKIFVTSRSSSRIAMIPKSASQIQITPELVRQDMENFVRHEIDAAVASKLLLEGILHLDTRRALENALLDGAGEMFLWVKLQIESICRETVEDDVVATLRKRLPESVDQLYQCSLDSISRAGVNARDLAMKVLSWVLYMREPLTPRALLATLKSDRVTTTLDANQLMNACCNLVLLDTQCNVVRFSHQSVQDFLEGHQSFAAGTAHSLLASLCIEACSRGPVAAQSTSVPSDDFYMYAAMYWPVHAKMAEHLCISGPPPEDANLTHSIITFMFDEDWMTTLSFELWIQTLGAIVSSLERNHEMLLALSAILAHENWFLFLFSTFGLDHVLRTVLSKIESVNVNQENQDGCKPVYLASAFGHTSTVTVLASYGGTLNIECGKFGSPLHAACFNGHLQVVTKLLELGVHTACGSTFENALQAAFRGGREDVAMHLVDHSSVITNEDEYDNAMQGAALIGFVRVVELLDGSRFKPLRKDNDDKVRKRLMKAIQGGQLGVLRQFLLQPTGKHVLIPPDAIAVASLHNHKDLVEFLLDQGMDMEVEGAFGTPLRTAALLDHRPLICLLLKKGARINAGGAFGTALQAAALKGHDSIVKLLIEEGADVNQHTGFYGSAIQAAAYHGQLRAVELLLDAKSDINIGFSKDAFHAAAASGHEEVIALMLRKGYTNPRQYLAAGALAAFTGPSRNVCLWTERGRQEQHLGSLTDSRPVEYPGTHGTQKPLVNFDVIFGEEDGDSKVSHASNRQISRLQEEALKKSNLLQAAACASNVDTVRFLLERKNDLEISDDEIKLAVESAAEVGQIPILEHILEAIKSDNSIHSHISGIIEKGHTACQSDVVTFGLSLATLHLSTEECSRLQETVATEAEKYRKTSSSKKKTISNFALSCKAGDVQLLTTILEMGDHTLLSPKDVVRGLHICALNGRIEVAEILLEPPFWQDWMSISGERLFITAAASGSVAIMKLIVLKWPQLLVPSRTTALRNALVRASENGHIHAIRYLVLDLGAEVNTLSSDETLGPFEQPFEDRFFLQWCSTDEYLESDSEDLELLTHINEEKGSPRISPLQAALRGFIKFDPETEHDRPMKDPAWSMSKHAAQNEHEQVITFLLEKGSNPNDFGGQRMCPIQVASKHCPEDIVDCFITARADVNMEGESEEPFFGPTSPDEYHLGVANNKNALFAAAGRELSTLSLVRKLITAGATLPNRIEEQHNLLEQALRYFQGDGSKRESQPGNARYDGRFTVTPSLDYLVNEGCGGTLLFLLDQMPHIRTTKTHWNLVLQMAAFLGNTAAVDLLLSRGTEVNSIGYYCGTALEAASWAGHENLTQRLLDAGAHVNTVAGQWKTALRASLLAGQRRTAKVLLACGAEVHMALPTSQNSCAIGQTEKEAHTDLQLGVATQDLTIVEVLLAKGANAVIDPPNPQHPLLMASGNGDTAIVKALIKAGAPVNIHGKERRNNASVKTVEASSMHAASAGGHLDVVKVLLDNGADIEINVGELGTPLAVAAAEGKATVVRYLLSAGALDTDHRALKNAVNNNHVEVVRALLETGAEADSMLAIACERGHIETIELLVENINDSNSLETALDDAFAVSDLEDSVIQLLLCYAAPTPKRFLRVCAAGSPSSVKSMLDQGDIDINLQLAKGGDFPLQVAALHLNFEVVRLLAEEGACIECTSAEHGTPLITALEACVGPMLLLEKDEMLRSIVDKLSLPIDCTRSANFLQRFLRGMPPVSNRERRMYQRLPNCEAIVQLLIDFGANVADAGRPLGSPLHVACLLGRSQMFDSLVQRGADLDVDSGYFEKPIFAAIHGKSSHIISVLLERMPNPNVVHTEYATPLHYASAMGDAASVRALLEIGADVTSQNLLGHTPLTVALENARPQLRPCKHKKERPLDVILSMAESLCVSNQDMIAASKLADDDRKSIVGLLLCLDKTMTLHEDVMCNFLSSRSRDNAATIKLLMPRMQYTGVTDRMLKSVVNENVLKILLDVKPVERITAEVLLAQENLRCMQLLLNFDQEAPVNEEIVLRALSLRDWRSRIRKDILIDLFDRRPKLFATQDMLQVADSEKALEILLSHLRPEEQITLDTVEKMSWWRFGQGREILRLLLKHDSSIQLSDQHVFKALQHADLSPVDILEIFLDCRPSMIVTPEVFLLGWKDSNDDARLKLPALLEKHGKRVLITDEVRVAIDEAYQLPSQTSKKRRFYELCAADDSHNDRSKALRTSQQDE